MLAFNHLGRLGQLGNQMFQYAALKGIAERHGYDFMIPNNKDVMVDSLGNKLRTEIFMGFFQIESSKRGTRQKFNL